ncbi:MAG TPA: hypothetical protein PLU83_14880 [Phycicoccus sp.]|nr:hypothetical protein [Phycicoccus sp.]
MLNENNTQVETDGALRPLSRRTIAKGVAWSAPVVAVGAMAPLAAATPEPTCVQATLDANACKIPPKQYKMQICLSSTCPDVTKIEITAFQNGSGKDVTPSLNGTYDLPKCFDTETYDAGSSANSLIIYYKVVGDATGKIYSAPFNTPTKDCSSVPPA